jgi:SNF2 family DNA or RNA helicase
LTGKTTKKGERTRLVRGFQNGDYRVLVVSTMAGGVSITLDRADTVHVLDETWVPDDQDQLIDRIHRASRIHQVTAYFYRTRNTLEEYINEVNQEKAFTNENVLDIRRNGFRAIKEGAR